MHAVYQELRGGHGELDGADIHQFASQRRRLGHKTAAWTERQNEQLLDRIGLDRQDKIRQHRFVQYFATSLPREPAAFEHMRQQLMLCAQASRVLKDEQCAAREEAVMNRQVDECIGLLWARAERMHQHQLMNSPAPAPASAPAPAPVLVRHLALRAVFRAFDFGSRGWLTGDEIFMLGQTRRELRQRGGEWTEATNRAFIDRISGTDARGLVSEERFVQYFEQTLPTEPAAFSGAIDKFMLCALACRQARREEAHRPKARNSLAQINANAGTT